MKYLYISLTIIVLGTGLVASTANAPPIDPALDVLNHIYSKVVAPGSGDPANPARAPEPGTMLLFGIGMAGLAALGMRRKN